MLHYKRGQPTLQSHVHIQGPSVKEKGGIRIGPWSFKTLKVHNFRMSHLGYLRSVITSLYSSIHCWWWHRITFNLVR